MLLTPILLFLALNNCSEQKKEETTKTIITKKQHQTVEEKETPGQHFLSRFNKAKYPNNFTHFDYVNPDAPKGGTLKLATVGTFDKVNWFLLKGRAAAELMYTFDKLFCESADEGYVKYGLLVKTCEQAEDYSWVTFHLHENARFQDGTPVTSEDVKETILTLQTPGILPLFKRIYSRIKDIETPDPHTVTLRFHPDANGKYDRIYALVLGNIITIAKSSRKILADNILEPVITAGPYVIKDYELGQFLHFQKNPYYYGKDFPVNKGKWNFDDVKIYYFKQDRSLLEAFKKGEFDIYFCTSPQEFENFECPNENFVKLDFKHKRPVQVQTIVLNQESPILSRQAVRDAFNLALSFDEINRVCFQGKALHARSLFENTGLGHKGLPSEEEIALWQTLKDKIGDDAFYNRLMSNDVSYFSNLPKEERIKKAENLLIKAGFEYSAEHGCRINKEGQKLEFDLIIRNTRIKFSRFLTPYQQDLARIGIKLNIIPLEESQYRTREDEGQYDLMIMPYNLSNSPGVELLSFFGKVSGTQKSSANYINLVDDVVDDLALKATDASTKEELDTVVKALDRYICLKGYVVLLDYNNSLQLIYRRDRIDFPRVPSADINVWERGWRVG